MKQEQQKLKTKTKEFTKKYFTYQQTDQQLSAEFKQELTKLGAFKPFYADHENERSIFLINMWKSDNTKVKNIVIAKAQEYFSINEPEKIIALLDNIHQDYLKVKARMQKMKAARETKKNN